MSRKHGSPGKGISIIIILIVLFCGSAASFLLMQRHNRLNREQQVYEELSQLRELVTNRQVYRSVIYSTVRENFLQERSLLFTADFHVTAGIDLSRGFSLEIQGNSAYLTLPAGEILLVDADDTSLEQVFTKERFSAITTGDYLPLLTEEKENIRKQAVEKGIQKEAEIRARQIFSGMLKMTGYDRVFVTFRREFI